jgi:hypothetical protein
MMVESRSLVWATAGCVPIQRRPQRRIKLHRVMN